MRIGVVARFDVEEAVEMAEKIVEFLMENEVDTLIDSQLATHLKQHESIGCDLEDMDVDMVVAVGGDGTVLRTQGIINRKKIPLVGINKGAVGFLTEIDPEDALNALEQVLNGNYFVDKRTQLKICTTNSCTPHSTKLY